jgi:hypothetical protein
MAHQNFNDYREKFAKILMNTELQINWTIKTKRYFGPRD